MKKAVIILAHQKPQQLNIFLSQLLTDAETDVFIHVNKLNEGICSEIISDPRVFISQKKFEIHWGSDEILQAIIHLLKEIKKTGKKYEYVIICSGQDLLVRSGLDDYLSAHRNQVFVDCDNRNTEYMDRYIRARILYKWPQIYRRKYEHRYHPFRIMRSIHFRRLLKQPSIGKKNVRYDASHITFYKDYWQCGLPMEVVDYFLTFISEKPDYLEMYKNAYIPEEGFFSTFVLNSPFSDWIIFHDGFSEALTYRAREHNDHPVILTQKDIGSVEKSNCFFARKFDIDVDAEVIDYFRKKVQGGV